MKTLTKSSPVLTEKQRVRVVPYYLGHFLIYLGFLIVTLVIAWLIFKTYRIYTTYQAISQHLDALETIATAGPTNPTYFSFVQIEDNFQDMAQGIETLNEDTKPFLPLTPYLEWVPLYGGNLEALPALLAISQDLSQTGMLLFKAFSPALNPEVAAGQEGLLPDAVANLTRIQADLKQAEIKLRQHQAALNQIKIERLSPGVARRVTRLKQYLPQMILGLQVGQQLPDFMGAESPRTYLILAQNSDELRPTGGYINAAGHIVFDRGQIVEFVMMDSYAVDRHLTADHPYPPEPIRHYMAADYWVLRDASWSPDFPTTAHVALDLYKRGQGISADGVIAFNQQALPYLLRAFEPLVVEDEQVTDSNVIKLMQKHWAPKEGQDFNKAWWSQRKSFMLALAETLRQKVEHEPKAIKFSVLLSALQQALVEKHLLIYLPDPAWDHLLAEQNWSGSLFPTQGDYLMIVDANLGFNKADALIERRLRYQVALAKDGSAQAHAGIMYRHLAQKQAESCRHESRYDPVYKDNMARCYWDYMRLVVPAEAQLINGPNVVVAGEYLLKGQPTTGKINIAPTGVDKISWGQLFLLAPEESVALDFVYALPPGTAYSVNNHWEYSLYLQKQPGTVEPPAEVIITLPEGAQLLSSQPSPSSQQGTMIAYHLSLKTDQKIQVLYELPLERSTDNE